MGVIAVGDNPKAELSALLFGLRVTWNLQFKDIVCISDSLHALSLGQQAMDPLCCYQGMLVQDLEGGVASFVKRSKLSEAKGN